MSDACGPVAGSRARKVGGKQKQARLLQSGAAAAVVAVAGHVSQHVNEDTLQVWGRVSVRGAAWVRRGAGLQAQAQPGRTGRQQRCLQQLKLASLKKDWQAKVSWRAGTVTRPAAKYGLAC